MFTTKDGLLLKELLGSLLNVTKKVSEYSNKLTRKKYLGSKFPPVFGPERAAPAGLGVIRPSSYY